MEQIEGTFIDLFPPERTEEPETFLSFSEFLYTHDDAYNRILEYGLIDLAHIKDVDFKVFLMPFVCIYLQLQTVGETFPVNRTNFQAFFCSHMLARYQHALDGWSSSFPISLLVRDLDDRFINEVHEDYLFTHLSLMSSDYYFRTYVQPRFPAFLLELGKSNISQFAVAVNNTFIILEDEMNYYQMLISQFHGYHLRYGLSTRECDLFDYFRGVPYHPALTHLAGVSLGDFLIEYLQLEDKLTNPDYSSSDGSQTFTPSDISVGFHIDFNAKKVGNINDSLKNHSIDPNCMLPYMLEQNPNLQWDVYRCRLALQNSFSEFVTLDPTLDYQNELKLRVEADKAEMSFFDKIPSLKVISDDGITEWSGIAHKIFEFMTVYGSTLFPSKTHCLFEYHDFLLSQFH